MRVNGRQAFDSETRRSITRDRECGMKFKDIGKKYGISASGAHWIIHNSKDYTPRLTGEALRTEARRALRRWRDTIADRISRVENN